MVKYRQGNRIQQGAVATSPQKGGGAYDERFRGVVLDDNLRIAYHSTFGVPLQKENNHPPSPGWL